jgi:NADPH2:quinone reductase
MALLDLLGRRWTLRVLWELRDGPVKFRDLARRADAMSQSVLSKRLNELETACFVTSDKDGWRLSDDGSALLQLVTPLSQFATRWAELIVEPQARQPRGKEVHSMASTIQLTRTGGPEVLKLETVKQASPGPHQAWVEQESIGVNFVDVMQRSGAVPIPLPSGLGLEGAGCVAAIGSAVTNVAVGDRVAYALGPLGSYASGRLYPADRLVRLPETLSFDDAATILFKGITAQYLLKSTYKVGAGTVVLLYGVAGALGQIMAPWAKHLGAFLIGVVSKEASVKRARSLGCDAVLVWGACDLPAEVAAITKGKKADVVYDGIGRKTFTASLDSLRPRGLLASIGASSGAPPPIDAGMLNAKGSLFLTRPSLATHSTDIVEYQERAEDVFAAVAAGIIEPSIWKAFPLADAVEAHKVLEQGVSAGAILLRP